MKKVTAQHAAHAGGKTHPVAQGKGSSKLLNKLAVVDSQAAQAKIAAAKLKKEEAEEAAKDQQQNDVEVAAQDMGTAGDATLAAMLQDASAVDAAQDSASGGSDDDNGGGVSPFLIAGGIALVAGGIALAATSGGSDTPTTPTPPVTPPVTPPANSAPTFATPTTAATTAEDTALANKVVATDANAGDVLTYTLATAATKGTVVVNANGTYTYTPTANFNGTDSFTVKVDDGKGGSATQVVNLTVTAVNDAPVFATATVTAAATEDTAFKGTATATDVDTGDKLTYAVGTAATKGTAVVNADGTYTYTPNANFNGTDSFTVKVTDAAGASAVQTVNVTVAAVNDAPVFAAAAVTATTAEDTAFKGSVTATDADTGDTLTYALGTAATKGTAVVNADGTYTYTPTANFNGTDSFTVTTKDAAGATATQTVNVTVTAVNDAPTFATPTVAFTGTEEVAVKGNVVATDVDTGDTLTYALGTGSTKATVTVNADGSFVYTPVKDFNGTDSFTVKVTDSAGASTTQTVNLTLAAAAETVSIDVGTTTTPITFNAGVDSLGQPDNFLFTDDSSKETNVILTNFTKGDQVQVTGASSQYSFTTTGSDIIITFNNTAAGVLNSIRLPGAAVNAGVFVNNEATAEQAAGFDFFSALTIPAAVTTSLDTDNDGNIATVFNIAATAGADTFTENANVGNNVRVTGFAAASDIIAVSNSPTTAYSFSSTGNDVVISLNNAGVVSNIVLAGVVPVGFTGLINSEASAEAALGANFFQMATATTPPVTPPAPPPAATTSSIDVGSITTPVAFDAATGNITFTDNAGVATNVRISNLTAGDLINVTGATSANYSFTSGNFDGGATANDLQITFNNTAANALNTITILNVVNPSAFVFNEATAEAAVGFNFINFG